MSLTGILRTANSGLVASQVGMGAVSDNIANVNTPGYVRKIVDQTQLVVGGRGMGVEVSGVKRVTDQYLQMATLTASSEAGRWDAVSQYLDNAQSLFGDPSGESFFFSRLDEIWSAFSATANDPSSSLLRSQALSAAEDFLNEGARINASFNNLGRTVDTKISADIDRINGLLDQINKLNADISRAKMVQADASEWIAEQKSAFDVLQIDLYDASARGPVCDSVGFYSDCFNALKDTGMATINLFGDHPSFEKNMRHLNQAFNDRVIALPEIHDGNRIALAFKGEPIAIDWAQLYERADAVKSEYALPAKRWVSALKSVCVGNPSGAGFEI